MINHYYLNTIPNNVGSTMPFNATCLFQDRFITKPPSALPLGCNFFKEFFQQASFNHSEIVDTLRLKNKILTNSLKQFSYKDRSQKEPYYNYFEKTSGCGITLEDFKTCSEPVFAMENSNGQQTIEFKKTGFKATTDFKSYFRANWEDDRYSDNLSIVKNEKKIEINQATIDHLSLKKTAATEVSGSCTQNLNQLNCKLIYDYKRGFEPWYSFITPKSVLELKWVRSSEAKDQGKEKHQITFNHYYKYRNIASKFILKPIFNFFNFRNLYAKMHWDFNPITKTATGQAETRGVKGKNPAACESEITADMPGTTHRFQFSPNEVKTISKIIPQSLISFHAERKLDTNGCDLISGKFRKFNNFDIPKETHPSTRAPALSNRIDDVVGYGFQAIGDYLFEEEHNKRMEEAKKSRFDLEGSNCQNKQKFKVFIKDGESNLKCNIHGERTENNKEVDGKCTYLMPFCRDSKTSIPVKC